LRTEASVIDCWASNKRGATGRWNLDGLARTLR